MEHHEKNKFISALNFARVMASHQFETIRLCIRLSSNLGLLILEFSQHQ